MKPTLAPSIPTSVYRYYDAVGILLYVGITARGPRRQGEHNADKDWWPYVARQEVDHYPSRAEAAAQERGLIRRHRPPFNKQHNPDHEAMRTLYLASGLGGNRKMRGTKRPKLTSKDARVIQAAVKGKVPMLLSDKDAKTATYVIGDEHAPLVMTAIFPDVVLLRAPKKVGIYDHRYLDDDGLMYLVFKRAGGNVPLYARLHIKTRQPYTLWAHEAVAA